MLERNPGLPVSVGVIVTISILVSIWLPIPAMAVDKEMNMAYPSSIEPVEFEAAYSVENGAIVSHNGARFFIRPLYGPNMPVVVLAGDRPLLRLIDEQF